MLRRLLILLTLLPMLSIGVGLASAHVASAQELNTGLNEVGQTVKLSSADPRVIATNIINIALGFIGIILVAIILYAGFLYMTSGGEADKVATAKKMIVSAIIGLVITLSAWAIARFVIQKLLEATQGGGGPSTSSGQGGGGGFGSSGGSNVFQLKSITP